MVVLSLFLVISLFLVSFDVYAVSLGTFTFKKYQSYTFSRSFTTGTGSVSIPMRLSLFFTSKSGVGYIPIPSNANYALIRVYGNSVTGISSLTSGGSASFEITGAHISGLGVLDSDSQSLYGYSSVNNSVLNCACIVQIPSGLSNFYFDDYSIVADCFFSSSSSVYSATSYFTFDPIDTSNCYVQFYADLSDVPVTRQDILDQNH